MTVDLELGHLLLCSWWDELGRIHRETFSADALVFPDAGHVTWLRAFVRLASRYSAVAVC